MRTGSSQMSFDVCVCVCVRVCVYIYWHMYPLCRIFCVRTGSRQKYTYFPSAERAPKSPGPEGLAHELAHDIAHEFARSPTVWCCLG